MMSAGICLIYSTFGNLDDARKIGRALVEERLAACVNIVPKINSIYWWKGEVEDEEEALLIAKTTEDNVDKVMKRLRELHPYEVPAILVIPLSSVLKEFADYVKSEVK